MTKNDAKKRIAAAIKKLNAMNNNVYFELEETKYSVQLICRSKSIKSTRFGAYGFIGMFDNYKKKSEAYITCMPSMEAIKDIRPVIFTSIRPTASYSSPNTRIRSG